MGGSLVRALASTPRSEKAMTQTMGNLGRMRPRASKRDFFRTTLTASAFASLRSVRTKIQNRRGGNDARRKAWKTQTPSFPPFPPRLEIRHKPSDFHIPAASATGSLPNLPRAPPHPIG